MRSVSIYKLQADGNVSKVQNSALERHVVLHFFEGGLAHDNILSRDFGRRGNLLYFRTIPVGTIKGNKIVLEYDIDINLEGYEICQK